MRLIGDHLRSLFRFAGREPRQPFWLWVLANYVLLMLLSMLAIVPLLMGSFDKVEQFAREHPDQVTRTVGPGNYSIEVHGYHPELIPDLTTVIWIFGIGVLIIVFLLAAAVVRRLHDSGRSGWWGIMPLPFLFGTFWGMSRLFALMPSMGAPDSGMSAGFGTLFGLTMVGDLCYLATLILLIVFCCMPTQPGDNRFGSGFGGGGSPS